MGESTPGPNRRNSARRNSKKSSKAVCFSGKYGLGPNIAVALLDVSETGARLVVRSPLPVGEEVVIGLEAAAARQPTSAAAQVVWCLALADGNHCAGVHFEKPLNYALLQLLTTF